MKKYLVFTMILIAGITAYPQVTRSGRETKTEKGSEKKEIRQERSAKRSEAKAEKKSTADVQARTRAENQKSNADKQNNSTERSARTQTRVENKSNERKTITRSINDSDKKSQEQSKINTRSDQQRSTGNTEKRQTTTITPRTSSASRVYREGNGTFTRDDGTVIRHQNNEIFTSRKYKLDYDNYESLRRSDDFRRDYSDYNSWSNHRRIRVINHNNDHYVPMPWEQRRSRYYYRQPVHIDLIWTPLLFHRFMYYYPAQTNWDMEFGSQIETISAYDAQNYAGTVRRIYGKVEEVYYSAEDENYVMYIGAPFPYQDISIVVPRYIAVNISRSPKWYFENEFVWVVGLIDMWEGKPEIVVRDEEQIRKY